MTASMTPAIEVGDVVVSRPMPPTPCCRAGSCWPTTPTGPTGCGCTASRRDRRDGALITKGDANPSADSSPLHPDAVRGVGVLRVPWVGLPVVWEDRRRRAARCRDGRVRLCLLLALRRARRRRTPAACRPRRAAPRPSVTRRSLRAQRRRAPARVRIGRAFGLASSLAVTAALGATPAWAALADVTAAPGSIVAPPSRRPRDWGASTTAAPSSPGRTTGGSRAASTCS